MSSAESSPSEQRWASQRVGVPHHGPWIAAATAMMVALAVCSGFVAPAILSFTRGATVHRASGVSGAGCDGAADLLDMRRLRHRQQPLLDMGLTVVRVARVLAVSTVTALWHASELRRHMRFHRRRSTIGGCPSRLCRRHRGRPCNARFVR